MKDSINETCQICGHGCFKDWGYMQFHCGQCGAELGVRAPDVFKDDRVINAESLSDPIVDQICELIKTLSHDQQSLDHYSYEELCTGMALCLGPGKLEPLSQYEPTGSQFSESLKTLDGNQNQENIDKSALDDDEEDNGRDNGDTHIKAYPSAREIDIIWKLIQGIDQDEYLRMTRKALDDYEALKSLKTPDVDGNQGDMVAREMQVKPYAAHEG